MKPRTKTINILLLDGGLGDHLSSLIAVNYIMRNYPWITSLVWVPDYLKELAQHLLPDASIWSFTEMRGRYDNQRPTKTTKWDGVTSPMKIHLVDYAFLKLCDELPSAEHKNLLQITPDLSTISEFSLPDKYAVITTGYTANVREFPANEVNKVADYLISQGVTPIFLGQRETATGAAHTIKGSFPDIRVGIDLIDKTTVLQAANIMSEALAVVGVDNGLLHLAGCTQAPIVAGFTTVSPSVRLPYREGMLGKDCYTVVPDVSCRFCQQTTNFLYGHDYRNCLHEGSEPNKLLCIRQMAGEKFVTHLKNILGVSNGHQP